jgi:hypothetical protein
MSSRLPHGRAIEIGAVCAVLLVAAVLFVMNANVEEAGTPAVVQRGAMMAQPPSSAGDGPVDDGEDEIDFSDPTTGGLIPLMRVEGRMHERLSPNLRVGDLAARDGAPYARISVELIDALEEIIASTDAAIYILSGYRHPARNALPEIGGSGESQHMAGRAADLMSPDLSALDLAELVLMALGCEIGLGLYANSIHVDVRGRRAVWARDGAAFTGEEFTRWVATRCGDAMDDAASEETVSDVDPNDILADYEEEMLMVARRLVDAGMKGGVALDLRGEKPVVYAIPAASPDAIGLGLADLIESAHPGRYYAFACIIDDGNVIRGFMRF